MANGNEDLSRCSHVGQGALNDKPDMLVVDEKLPVIDGWNEVIIDD